MPIEYQEECWTNVDVTVSEEQVAESIESGDFSLTEMLAHYVVRAEKGQDGLAESAMLDWCPATDEEAAKALRCLKALLAAAESGGSE